MHAQDQDPQSLASANTGPRVGELSLEVGDPVIFSKEKVSEHPGPRAKGIRPAPRGETYSYRVEKYWVVSEQPTAGTVRLRTRRGKEHVVPLDSPWLRKPTWLERWLYRSRFPRLATG